MDHEFWQFEAHAARCALRDDCGRSITYRELAALSDRFAAQLKKPRSLVLLQCHNSIECVAAYLGCLRHGHVPLLLAANLNEQLLATISACYQPDYCYAPTQRTEPGHLPSYELTSYAPTASANVCASATACAPAAAPTKGDRALHPDLALLLSTSGSTGSPKLVRLSRTNLQSNAHDIAQYLELNANERPITSLPLNYSYGLSVINSHLLVGATILLTDLSVTQAEFWDYFKQEQASSLAGVPYTYQMLLRLRFTKMKLPSLKTLTQAGGHLDPDKVKTIAQALAPHGVRFFVMYGQTEATARMSYVPAAQLAHKPGSIGIAVPQGHFTLETDDGHEITTPHTTGVLVYRGPNVNLGYAHGRADLAVGDVNHGCLKTGDLAYFDEDHYFYIVGRQSRFIKLTGLRYSLNDCEQILAQHGFNTICTGHDEQLCILLLSAAPAPAPAPDQAQGQAHDQASVPDQAPEHKQEQEQTRVAQLKALVAATFHLHQSLYQIKCAPPEAVPRNEVGKVQYHELQQKFFA